MPSSEGWGGLARARPGILQESLPNFTVPTDRKPCEEVEGPFILFLLRKGMAVAKVSLTFLVCK